MAKVYEFEGLVPVVPTSSFVHPDAVLIGDVILGENCYIGPCACLRGDFGRIIVEDGANIQDCCVLHSFPEKEMRVEKGGHVGHGAILHGCVVGENALVGMNSVIMDGVTIGKSAFVGAQAFVKAGFDIPDGMLASGSPAVVVRPLSDKEIGWKTTGTGTYQQLAERCLSSLKPAQALTKVEPNRSKVEWHDNASIELRDLKKSETLKK